MSAVREKTHRVEDEAQAGGAGNVHLPVGMGREWKEAEMGGNLEEERK